MPGDLPLHRVFVGVPGRIEFDASKPEGAPRKLLDVSKLNSLGWRAEIDLRTGIDDSYRWYLDVQRNMGRD